MGRAAQVTVSAGVETDRSDAMVTMWRAGTLSDCEVVAEGRCFLAHRLVLAACSSFMRSAFTAGLAETATSRVTLEEVEASVFEAVLEFCYTGSATFGEGLSVPVLKAASRLGIAALESEMVALVINKLEPANCLAAWELGDALTLKPLVAAAEEAAKLAFAQVASTDSFLTIPSVWLESLLASELLVVDSEQQVYEAVKRWHAALSEPLAPEALGRLLGLVRWPLLPQEFVSEHVNTDPMIAPHAMVIAKAFQDVAYGARPQPRKGKEEEHLDLEEIMGFDLFD